MVKSSSVSSKGQASQTAQVILGSSGSKFIQTLAPVRQLLGSKVRKRLTYRLRTLNEFSRYRTFFAYNFPKPWTGL